MNMTANKKADDRVVIDLAKRFRRHVREEKRKLYFVSTTYLDPKAFPLTPVKATEHFKRFHKSLLQHLAQTKQYQRSWFQEIEPIVYAFLDKTGSKSKHYKTAPTRESTFHHHAMVIAHETHVSMLDALEDKTFAGVFVAKNQKFTGLRTLDVQAVGSGGDDVLRVTRYITEYARKHMSEETSYLVFPQSKDEFLSRYRRRTAATKQRIAMQASDEIQKQKTSEPV